MRTTRTPSRRRFGYREAMNEMMLTCASLSAAVTFVAGLLVGYCIGGAAAIRESPGYSVQAPTEKKRHRRNRVVPAERQATSEPTPSPRRESLAAVRDRVVKEATAELQRLIDAQQDEAFDVDKALRAAVGPSAFISSETPR